MNDKTIKDVIGFEKKLSLLIAEYYPNLLFEKRLAVIKVTKNCLKKLNVPVQIKP